MERFAPAGIIVVGILLLSHTVFAATPAEIEAQIQKRNADIQALEAEIAQYEKQLSAVANEKQTLESAVREIDISRRKVIASISIEEEKIDATEFEIERLGGAISSAEERITSGKDAVAAALRRLDILENQTYLETLLKSGTISDVWEEADAEQRFHSAVQERIAALYTAKEDYEINKDAAAEKRAELLDRQATLRAQKQALDVTKREKDSLLSETAERESAYQDLLDEKRAEKDAFEAALLELQSELAFTLDPARIPPAGKGVLRWPLDSVTITQKFGNTSFAQSGAYNGKGHNGVDFRASIGTPVRTALSGTVIGIGNTDQYRGCYSYGKWALVRHPNGLTTLYAHLSQHSVSTGDQLETGQIIGLSGNTGYSTGPHLHFSVFVSEAVQLRKLGDVKARTNCAQATIPIAPFEAYLNPLEYL